MAQWQMLCWWYDVGWYWQDCTACSAASYLQAGGRVRLV